LSKLTRRQFVGTVAAAGAVAATGPNLIRSQNASVEVVFYNIWGTPPGGEAPETKHPVDQVIDAFNEQSTDVQVVGQNPGNYFETLQKTQADLAAGNPPALVITPWSNIFFAYEGLGAVPLEEVAGDEFESTFGQIRELVLPLVQVEGNTIGLPYAFSCPVFYYNNDLVSAAGIDPEELFATWAGMLEQGPAMQDAVDGNPILAFGTNLDWPAQSIIQSNAGFVLNDDLEPVMNSPEAIAAMQTIADFDSAGLYDRSTGPEARASFVAGSIPFFVGSIAALGGLSNEVSFDLQTSTFPTFGDTPRMMSSGGSFIGMYAREEEQQQAAWEFLKFATSEEGYALWMQTGYLNATTHDLPTLDGQEAAYTQLEEGLTRESAWPTGRGLELQEIWGGFVERIWANDIDAEEGCNQAVDDINDVIESQG
jgi:multiple sugar transport system substrate-binding protein